MIVGIGVDVVEIARLKRSVEGGGERLEARLLAPDEREAGGGTPSVAHLAARFASKEAALKALGTGWSNGVSWHDVRVRLDGGGTPRLEMSGRAGELARAMGATRSHLALARTDDLVTALVVLETDA